MPRARPRKFFSSAFLITGTISPQSKGHGNAHVDFAVQHYRRAVGGSVHATGKARRASTQARTKMA